MNNCEHIKSILILWLTGELEPEEARLVENHLAECPECRREAEELRAFLPELEAALQDEPLQLSPERRNAIRRANVPSRWWERLGAIAAIVFVIGLVVSMSLPALSRSRTASLKIREAAQQKQQRMQDELNAEEKADTANFAFDAAPAAPEAPVTRASRNPSAPPAPAMPSAPVGMGGANGGRYGGMGGGMPAAVPGAVGRESAVRERNSDAEFAKFDRSGFAAPSSLATPTMEADSLERGNASPAFVEDSMPGAPEPMVGPAEALPPPSDVPMAFGGMAPERAAVPATVSMSRMEAGAEAVPEIIKVEESEPMPAAKEIRKKTDTGFAVGSVAMAMDQDEKPEADSSELSWQNTEPVMPESTKRNSEGKAAKIPMMSEISVDMFSAPAPVVNALPPMIPVTAEPVSTFGIDTDTASYVMNRDRIRNHLPVDPAGVRPEAFVNYLDYHYEAPREQEGAFRCILNAARHPFRPEHVIMAVGIQGRQLGPDAGNKPQFGVIVDASGSMALNDRWTPAVQSVALLQRGIGENGNLVTTYITDRAPGEFQIDVPTQPGGSANWLPGVQDTCDRMTAMPKPVDVPTNNQVLVITDGIFSPDRSSQEELLQMAESKRAEGFTMNVLGFGEAGNNEFWEKFAEKGGGTFLYVDGPDEVERIFTEQFEARFRPIAEDVKIQVEFNPAAVAAYRQIGYEDRVLTREQFRDDTVRTAPVGSGQAVTALYELELNSNVTPESPLATVRVRYRDPGSFGAREFERYFNAGQVADDFTATPESFQYAVLIGEWAESLRFPEASGVGQTGGIMALLPAPADWKQREFMQLLQQMR